MSRSISRDEFVRNLSEGNLLSRDDLRKTLDELAGESSNADCGALAEHLVRTGRLTTYQAAAVLRNRVDELRIGNYIVLDRLGCGGMGTVYKARHRRMQRVVALKVLAQEPGRPSSFAHRFQREVETIAQLSHPNVVMAFDADEDQAGPYLVMEFVDGRDLGSEVEQGGPLSLADALACVLQAARGLDYAHGQRVVHRDVKPSNLLRSTSGLVKVADLGLARLISSEETANRAGLTQAGGIVGTIDFMAPEQALDPTTVDHRADVYSLGCTLHYLLSGRAPYSAASLMALLLKHREASIPPLVDARPDAPAELEVIFQRMVAKNPSDRYSTMAEVVQALEALRHVIPLSEARPDAWRIAQTDTLLTEETLAIDPDEPLPPFDLSLAGPQTLHGSPLSSSEVRRSADMTVVFVECSRPQASIIRSYLEQLGIEKIHSAGSGQQALEIARREGAHVLLSAMHLSDMTGLELAHALHADPRCADVGFVLASSEADGWDPGTELNSSRMVMLAKPFDLPRLARSLAQAIGSAPEDLLSACASPPGVE